MVKKVGVDILSEIVSHLKTPSPSSGPRGFHFYTLNLEKAVSFILERTSLIPPSPPPESAILDDISNTLPIPKHSRRQSSIGSDPHNRIIVTSPDNPNYETAPIDAAVPAEPVNTRANTLAISEGEGSLGREATWDDYPNGRWGDARSPAYGEIDGYGVSLHMSVSSAIKSWGYPTSPADITQIFLDHLEGKVNAIPWSEEGLNPETHTIKPSLLKLNEKGWWTVASQPAVNGVSSSDSIFGWGPRNGFVFQKAFVELFVPSSAFQTLLARLQSEDVSEHVSFYASNADGEFLSSRNEQGATNAVTWGAFPGKEIITPTIIEEVSFRAWAEEAFGIWAEWGRVYAGSRDERGKKARETIEAVRADCWLVNVIHHGYVEKDGLWDLLLT